MRAGLAGQLPPAPKAPRLPPEKSAFPKLLMLDANQWIFLSRVHHGLSADPGATAALAAIRQARGSGRLVVALHMSNVFEAAKRSESSSRERLARFMVEESGNVCLRPFDELLEAQIRGAILKTYLGKDAPAIRPDVLAIGVDGIAGTRASETAKRAMTALGAPQFAPVLDAVRLSPEATVDFITDAMRRNSAIENDAERERRGAEIMNNARKADVVRGEKERARIEMSAQWEWRHGDRVRRALSEFNIEHDVFKAWLDVDKNLLEFWSSIPGFDVPLILELRAGKQVDGPFEPNDFRDMNLHEVVVPYANVAVLEKHWANLIVQTKLDRKYGTRVLRRLADLPDALKIEDVL